MYTSRGFRTQFTPIDSGQKNRFAIESVFIGARRKATDVLMNVQQPDTYNLLFINVLRIGIIYILISGSYL